MSRKFLIPILGQVQEEILEDGDKLFERKTEDEAVRSVLIRNLQMNNEDLSHMRFSSVVFENCIFQDCSFEKGEFTDVAMRSCDFSNCSFEDSYFNRMEFRASKAVGTKFSGSTMLHTSIWDCNFNYANFDSSKLEYFRVSDSQLQGSFFTQCRCKVVEWNRVSLNQASFFKTSMKGMDFTGSSIMGLMLSEDGKEIKGAVVDLYQAAELAKYLGVIIKNDGLQ